MLALRNRNSFPLAIPFANRYTNIRLPQLSGAILREMGEILNHTNARFADTELDNWNTEETDEAKVFSVALPGVKPELISVEVSGSYINVSVSSENNEDDSENADDPSTLYRFKIDENSDTEAITAKAELGVLRIAVPKTDSNISRDIPVEVAA